MNKQEFTETISTLEGITRDLKAQLARPSDFRTSDKFWGNLQQFDRLSVQLMDISEELDKCDVTNE